jgi:hypothetical protein
MYRAQSIHGCGMKLRKDKAGMAGKGCGCSGGEILLGSPVALAPSGPNGSGGGISSFPNLSRLDISKKKLMKKISF